MKLRFATVCSGIEAMSVAAAPMQWTPVFFSEIEKGPCSLLSEKYPDVPNLGDMTKIDGRRYDGAVDILAGGTPCQDVSVAGKRAGMRRDSGTRSSLAFHFARLAGEMRPRWLLWENVPGVLASNGGRDFAAFVVSMRNVGYSIAWRVLDAQWTRVDGFPRAVPQRRRRVWLVGHLGAERERPAEVLFERESVRGDSSPRRIARQAAAAGAGTGAGGASAFRYEQFGEYRRADIAAALVSSGYKRAEGIVCGDMTHADEGLRVVPGGASPTLQSRMGTGGNQVPLVFKPSIGRRASCKPQGETSFTLSAQPTSDSCQCVALTLAAESDGDERQCIVQNQRNEVRAVCSHLALARRFTPTECERLMGFPDGYTACMGSDSARYKALGNSWAVNCARWILRRIDAAEGGRA